MLRSGLALRRTLTGVVTLLFAGALTANSAAACHEHRLDTVKRALERFKDVRIAQAAGYELPPEGPLHECIDEDVDLDDDDGKPAMGLHFINADLLDGKVRAKKPEALVYAPRANGSLRLVAVEYVVFEEAWTRQHAPHLLGRMFMKTDAPNRYEIPPFYALHAWLFKKNPSGTFANFNPRVSC